MIINFVVEHITDSAYYHTTHEASIPDDMFPKEVIDAIMAGDKVDVELWHYE